MEKDGTNGTNMGKDGNMVENRWETYGKRWETWWKKMENTWEKMRNDGNTIEKHGDRWEHMCKTVVLDPVKNENLLCQEVENAC